MARKSYLYALLYLVYTIRLFGNNLGYFLHKLRIFFLNFIRNQNGKSDNFPRNPINAFLADLRFFFLTGKENLGLTLVTLEARKPSSMDLSRPCQTPRPADQCLGSRRSPVLVQCRAQRRATAGDIWRERRRPLDCPMLLWACGAELLVYSSVVLSCELVMPDDLVELSMWHRK